MADPKTDFSALNGLQGTSPRTIPRWAKTLIFIFEVVFVAGLLAWWLSVPSLRESKSLWILFLYCFPAEFLIATVPHEPVILYFGKFYGPLTVAAISAFGTVLTEILNYTFFKYIADLKLFKKMLESRSVQKAVRLFNRAPFLALWVAGFTPIPFYPFRFLVVLARYPIVKYLLAVILSRTPRMYILALAGRAIRFPDYMLAILMAVLIIAANIPILGKLLRRKKSGDAAAPLFDTDRSRCYKGHLPRIMNHPKPSSKTTCLVNPRAANNKWERNGKLRRDLEKKLPGRIRHLMGDRMNTVELTRQACDESGMIVAIGGDGTIADVLQGIFEAKKENEVAFGVIPFGSGNAFRKSLGIPKNPAKAIDVLTRGRIVKADIMEVEGRYAGFASVGAMAGVTQEKLRNPVYGLLGHLLATWKIFQLPRDKKTIELVDGVDDKGKRFERKTFTSNFFDCVVCKTNFFGYSWRIAPKARIADGYLDITFFEFSPVTFLAAFPLIYLGLFQRTQRHFKARKITIHGKSLPVQYNGEVLGELDTVTFRVLPASLRVIVNK